MATALDIIKGSLRLIGVVHKSEPLTADEAQDGLERLNEMIESWSNDSLLVFARSWVNFPLVGNVGEYTIGTGQDFNTPRPSQIISAYMTVGGSDISYPLVPITDDQYALEITQKNIQSNIPTYYNYDNGFPVGKIRLWCVPSAAGTIYLQNESQVASFPDLTTVIDLPPGWLKALRYNLAVELAPEYDVKPSSLVMSGAAESKGILKSQVLKNRPLTYMPSPIGYGYDVYGDIYR